MLELPEYGITTSQGDLKYLDTKTNGPALVCLHGNTSCKEVFVHQFAAFAEGYRVIAPDLPGFGESFRAKDPHASYQISSMAKTIREFLVELQLEQVIIFGWSLGGHIGIELLREPTPVVQMISFGTPLVTADNPAGAFLIREEFIEFFDKLSYTEAEARMFFSGACSEAMTSNQELIKAAMHADGRARRVTFESILSGNYDQAETVLQTQIPTTMFMGDNDPVINFNYQRDRLRHLFTVYENSLHDGFYESHERFNQLLAAKLILVA